MKSPAFQFYATDYLGSQRVQMLTLEEEGAYIRLLCYCWQHGSIPSKAQEIARLVGKGCSSNLARVVGVMFEPHPDDATKLIHSRLEIEKEKQSAWKQKCAVGGRKSAELKKNPSRVVELPLQLPLQGSTNIPSPSPSPSPIIDAQTDNGVFPTLAEVVTNAEMIGMTKDDAEKFWHHFESSGWIDKNGHPVKNWRSKQTTWKTVARAMPAEASHRQAEGGGQNNQITLSKEYERCIARIRQLKEGCAQNAMGERYWQLSDRAEFDALIKRRNELKTILKIII